jgi:hypothetical protein
MNISVRAIDTDAPAPEVCASREINTEAGVYPSVLVENGDGTPVAEMPFLEALENAENPHWDGCIGEATARRLAMEYRLIERRLRKVCEDLRDGGGSIVPSRATERYVLTGELPS